MVSLTTPSRLQELLAKLHRSVPSVPTSVPTSTRHNGFPLTMVIPPEQARMPELALPRGQWKREGNGGIKVTFNSAEELELCLDATRAIRNGGEEANNGKKWTIKR